ncbi:HNH endonuclease [Paractinoplanes toevensis]|uniref:Outer membrane channel protein CpnT-like N-terminal domain-containing protein n=1 Tax=Paractinoplanes toevensis TaxID=571911 RepID=A0A919TJF5_9ACTN|nr:HNH endonuclease [Actinoplanes toevensis]GIM95620.1 hypothetical protein Ato02nite_074130 [Actinoplanes toevensis]
MGLTDVIEKHLPGYPHGKPGEIRDAAASFRNLATGIGNLADRGQSSVSTQTEGWDDPVKTAFIDEWNNFRSGLNDVSGQIREVADRLDSLADDLANAQHKYNSALVAVGVTAAVGIGLTVITFGVSDEVAGAAVAAEVATVAAAVEETVGVGAALLSSAGAMIGQISTRLVIFFTADVAAQSVADTIVYPDHNPVSHIDLETAGITAASMVALGGAAGLFGKIGATGTAPNLAARVGGVGLTSAGLDAATQQLTNHKINMAEVGFAGLTGAAGERLAARKLSPSGPSTSIELERPPAVAEPPDMIKSVQLDSRGRVIPEGVERLPSGKLPANFEYAGKVYDGARWTPELAQEYPKGVRFTEDGFPDFSPYATHTVTFDPHFVGNHSTDFTAANRLAGLAETPEGYTWHHTQDTRTMQLIPTDLHDAIRHAGGVAIMKGRN